MGYHSKFMTCCVKRVCNGCCLATQTRGSNDCPFCRTSTDFPDYKSAIAMVRKRAEKKDPSAIHFLGDKYFFGNYGLKKDVPRAVEMWTEAAELGSLKALCALGNAHLNGLGGLAIDRAKGFEFWETAARKGHADSRHNLGTSELQLGNCDRKTGCKSISRRNQGYVQTWRCDEGSIRRSSQGIPSRHGRNEKPRQRSRCKGRIRRLCSCDRAELNSPRL
mmetsp:Transcript_25193/g.59937  ORF Transcript_25193/g.59937 Transcript_25193/m.59937 type:complete len:220 (+) Transcript_25193:813-1472(+)